MVLRPRKLVVEWWYQKKTSQSDSISAKKTFEIHKSYFFFEPKTLDFYATF